MNAQLVLGCNGARRYGLSICKGTTNSIVDLRKLGGDYNDIISYLDNNCKIFDNVIDDINTIGNIVSFLNRYTVFPKHVLDTLYDYIAMHKGCGLYMFVDPIKEV